ncbi:unnamed protein product, partial [Brenthis ino]
MFTKTVFAFAMLILIVPWVTTTPLQSRSTTPLELVSIIELEEPCVRQGGLCLRVEDCEPDNLVQMKGILCPMQSHMGVECCYN